MSTPPVDKRLTGNAAVSHERAKVAAARAKMRLMLVAATDHLVAADPEIGRHPGLCEILGDLREAQTLIEWNVALGRLVDWTITRCMKPSDEEGRRRAAGARSCLRATVSGGFVAPPHRPNHRRETARDVMVLRAAGVPTLDEVAGELKADHSLTKQEAIWVLLCDDRGMPSPWKSPIAPDIPDDELNTLPHRVRRAVKSGGLRLWGKKRIGRHYPMYPPATV